MARRCEVCGLSYTKASIAQLQRIYHGATAEPIICGVLASNASLSSVYAVVVHPSAGFNPTFR
jgi:hypothetical protein